MAKCKCSLKFKILKKSFKKRIKDKKNKSSFSTGTAVVDSGVMGRSVDLFSWPRSDPAGGASWPWEGASWPSANSHQKNPSADCHQKILRWTAISPLASSALRQPSVPDLLIVGGNHKQLDPSFL